MKGELLCVIPPPYGTVSNLKFKLIIFLLTISLFSFTSTNITVNAATHVHSDNCYCKGVKHTHVTSCGRRFRTATLAKQWSGVDCPLTTCIVCNGIPNIMQNPRAVVCGGTDLYLRHVTDYSSQYGASGHYAWCCSKCGETYASGGCWSYGPSGGGGDGGPSRPNFTSCNNKILSCNGAYVDAGTAGDLINGIGWGESKSRCPNCTTEHAYSGGHGGGTMNGVTIESGSYSYPEYYPGKKCINSYQLTCGACNGTGKQAIYMQCGKEEDYYDGDTKVLPSCDKTVVSIAFNK